jgi:hypothetical protein
VVDGGGLENHCTGNGAGGSNPSPSAKLFTDRSIVVVERGSFEVVADDFFSERGRRATAG